MKSKRYFQLVERESNDVSLKWKVSHAILFIVTVVNSAIAAHAFSQIFDAFNNRCTLYAEPVFELDQIGYFNNSETSESVTEATEMYESTLEVTTIPTTTELVEVEIKPKIVTANDDEIRAAKILNWANASHIPGTDDYYLMNRTVYFKNASMYGRIHIKMMRSDESTTLRCNYILFTHLLSVIVASVLTGIVLVFGRGGRGYPSDTVQKGWRYVSVILIIAIVIFLLCLIATNMFHNGTKQFCKHFSEFTGTKVCNKYIDYFTQARYDQKAFHTYYLMAYYTFIINTCLWAAQLLLICFRCIFVADFQFYSIHVRKKRDDDDDYLANQNEKEEFQDVYRALKARERVTRVDPNLAIDEEDDDQNSEATAQV